MAILPSDVQNALKRQAPKALRREFEKKAKREFKEIKAEMIKEFLSHPVTQEIMEGPSAANISGTLGGVANWCQLQCLSTYSRRCLRDYPPSLGDGQKLGRRN